MLLIGKRLLWSLLVLDALFAKKQINAPTGPERFWSDPGSWPSGVLPKAGENVHIEPGWNMTLDLAETPELVLLRVNGILRFK